jgi:hypothetical protein
MEINFYSQIKADYEESMKILKQLKEDEDEARRGEKLLKKEM